MYYCCSIFPTSFLLITRKINQKQWQVLLKDTTYALKSSGRKTSFVNNTSCFLSQPLTSFAMPTIPSSHFAQKPIIPNCMAIKTVIKGIFGHI